MTLDILCGKTPQLLGMACLRAPRRLARRSTAGGAAWRAWRLGVTRPSPFDRERGMLWSLYLNHLASCHICQHFFYENIVNKNIYMYGSNSTKNIGQYKEGPERGASP